MFWISISIILSSGVFVAGWKAVVKMKEEALTERLKIDIENDQVQKYNEFLESANEHMVSDKLAKKFKIITIANDSN